MSNHILASLPLPFYCGILLLAKQHETKLVSILYCSQSIIEQLGLPWRLSVLYCSQLAVLSLYCSWMSSWDFHVDLYSGILATPIILWDLTARNTV
jgi:hypothetical protein